MICCLRSDQVQSVILFLLATVCIPLFMTFLMNTQTFPLQLLQFPPIDSGHIQSSQLLFYQKQTFYKLKVLYALLWTIILWRKIQYLWTGQWRMVRFRHSPSARKVPSVKISVSDYSQVNVRLVLSSMLLSFLSFSWCQGNIKVYIQKDALGCLDCVVVHLVVIIARLLHVYCRYRTPHHCYRLVFCGASCYNIMVTSSWQNRFRYTWTSFHWPHAYNSHLLASNLHNTAYIYGTNWIA